MISAANVLDMLLEGFEIHGKLLERLGELQNDDSDEGNEDRIYQARLELEALKGTVSDIVP